MSITNITSKAAGSVMNFSNMKLGLKKVSDYGFKNQDSFANMMLVTSIASKDALGCYYYVNQSLHNEKIPEDKRGFVAALDAVNGVLMVGGQFLIAKVFEKHVTSAVFDRTIGRKLDGDAMNTHANRFIKLPENIGKNLKREDICEKMIKEFGTGSQRYKSMRTGAGLFVSFMLTTAITKRVIVPFIATPIAGALKDKFMKPKSSEAVALKPTEINSTMPKTELGKKLDKKSV